MHRMTISNGEVIIDFNPAILLKRDELFLHAFKTQNHVYLTRVVTYNSNIGLGLQSAMLSYSMPACNGKQLVPSPCQVQIPVPYGAVVTFEERELS